MSPGTLPAWLPATALIAATALLIGFSLARNRRLQSAHDLARAELQAVRGQLQDFERQMRRHNDALLQIARERLERCDDLHGAYRAITEIASATLEVERLSVWRYDAGRQELACEDLYLRSQRTHAAGTVLRAETFPNYFLALQSAHLIDASDARTDARTREFGSYLVDNDIHSMLDSDIHLSGRLVGVVCCEHCGGPRQWTTAEQIFLGNVSDQLSLLLEYWQQKQDDAAIRNSEERYRSLVTATSQIVWTTNANGEVVEDSPTWRAFTGQTPGQMLGSGWGEAVHPMDRDRLGVGVIWQTGNTVASCYETEYRIRRHDGVYRIFSVRGAPVLDRSGAIREWVGTCDDVTDEREAQRALRRAHDELEQKVEERTRRLQAANARLRELDRLKSEFLATMSHELRTPLNSIIGFTHILREGLAGPVNDEQRKQLGMVANSASHLLTLINDLLDLSRIESGRMEIADNDIDCLQLLEEIRQTLAPLVNSKGLALHVEVLAPVRHVRSDRKKLFQILLNLANNAVKFTEHGSVTVRLSQAQSTLIFDVIDTGIGIGKENMPLLFEAFRQIEGSSRRRYEGTGLGLHLSLRLARLLGGDIRVTSEPGRGSTFSLIVPAPALDQTA
jgi:PAS domain S-box-containing protein